MCNGKERKMEYSPFIDNKGNRIGLNKLKFTDILNIEVQGIEEGYKVEFKSQWDENFKKKHLCQTISSFANAEGGWLFVGIEDNTGKYIGVEKQRTDFSQMISQKLIEVTPRPKFDCRFIHEPNNKKKGVLIIQIYEGINPPYVCNGTIYTRSGSSKIPIKSDRSSIDELINKRSKYNDILEKFCVNKFVGEREVFPYCTVYLYNPYANKDYSSYQDKEQNIKKRFKEDGNKGRIINSIDSVMRLGSDVISANSFTSIEQYYVDGNIKIHMPLFKLVNDRNISSWVNAVARYNKNVNLENMVIVDGMITYMTLYSLLQLAFEFIKNNEYKIQDYKVIFEYKNIQNVVFYYRRNFKNQNQKDKFIYDVQNGNFYVCNLTDVITDSVSFTENYVEDNIDGYAWSLLSMFYLRLFGIDEDVFNEILDKCEGRYDEDVFSSDNYQL